MSQYTVKLKSRREVAAGTMAFHWEKPSGFAYKAGQYADYTLLHPRETDDEGDVRSFTLAGAPYEEDLILATRMRDSAFKRTLARMEIGEQIVIDAPQGSFTLHDDASIPAVFLTGGIGATVARSILLQAIHDRLQHTIHLFYSCRRPEDAPFFSDLMKPKDSPLNYAFHPTMTQMDKSAVTWFGETGYITKEMLQKYIDDISRPMYYIDGPPDMVAAMKKMLGEAGIDENSIRTEDFEGY